MGAIPAASQSTSADGSDPGLHVVSSELPPSLPDDSGSLFSSVATLPSSTVVLDKAALGAIPPALPVHKDSVVRQMDPLLRLPLMCFIQPCVSPGPTVHKLWLCPRLCLCCLYPLRGPCRLLICRGSFRLGPAAAEPPLLASLRPPWTMVSTSRILLHQPSHDEPSPRENRGRLGVSRLPKLRLGPRSTQFPLYRSNTPTTQPHLLRLYLGPSLQRRLGVSASQLPSPRCHHRQKSSSSSLSSGTRTPIGRVNNAPDRFVTPPSGIFFADVPRSSPTISFFTWRLRNAPHCQNDRFRR